jgi:hypothetical protein
VIKRSFIERSDSALRYASLIVCSLAHYIATLYVRSLYCRYRSYIVVSLLTPCYALRTTFAALIRLLVAALLFPVLNCSLRSLLVRTFAALISRTRVRYTDWSLRSLVLCSLSYSLRSNVAHIVSLVAALRLDITRCAHD